MGGGENPQFGEAVSCLYRPHSQPGKILTRVWYFRSENKENFLLSSICFSEISRFLLELCDS